MELAKKITDYFEWNINEYLNPEFEEHWPKTPSDLKDPRDFIQAVKELFYKELVAIESHQVPRFTLTSYQPNWVLSHYYFFERNENTDSYLWNNFNYEKYEESWEAH